MWKGQYALFYGAEIGIYSRKGKVSKKHVGYRHYSVLGRNHCTKMSYSLYKNNNLAHNRSTDSPHWWVTAFQYGKVKSKYNLYMKNIKVNLKNKNNVKPFAITILTEATSQGIPGDIDELEIEVNIKMSHYYLFYIIDNSR